MARHHDSLQPRTDMGKVTGFLEDERREKSWTLAQRC